MLKEFKLFVLCWKLCLYLFVMRRRDGIKGDEIEDEDDNNGMRLSGVRDRSGDNECRWHTLLACCFYTQI